jgi:general secretion pathway protein D
MVGRSTLTRSLMLLLCGSCIAACANHVPTPQSSSSSTSVPGLAFAFGDLLNPKDPPPSDAVRSPNAAGIVSTTSSTKSGNGPAIYEGSPVNHEPILVNPPQPAPTSSQATFIPAAYRISENSGAVVEGGKYRVAFENADIGLVARTILGELLKANYTIDPRVHGTITLSAQRPLTRTQLLLLLESALRSQGAIMVEQDDIWRIKEATDGNAVGGTNIGPDAGAPGFGITALPLENISADALGKILEGFGALQGSIRVDATRNVLIVRGTTSERQWLIDTALAFDVDWMRNQSVGIFPVRTGSPEVIINELNQMADSSLVRLEAITRLNAILAVARSPHTIRQVQTWIERLDRENDYGPRVHVYRLKSAEAKKVVAVLREVFGASGGGAGESTGSGGTATAIATPIAQGPGNQTPPTPGANPQNRADANTAGGSRANELRAGPFAESAAEGAKIRITADTSSNSVVVYANQEDYRRVERAILELDLPSAEVAIEAIAAEVTLNDTLNYGVQFYLQGTANSAKNQTGSIAQISATGLPLAQTIPGFNAVLGSLGNPTAVINALRDVTDVKILSSPSLVVANNQAAVLQVGDQVPVTTGTATSTVTTQSAIVNSVSYVDTGVILRVTPHISRTSEVRLDIEQEVSSVVQNSNAATLTPTISQQKVKSTIDIQNGQTILLAGLISQQRSMEKSGIPGVIDIPLFGNALSNSNNSASRTELIIFVKPHVIHSANDAQRAAQELRRRMPGFNNW